MYCFTDFTLLEAKVAGTIGHLEHVADRAYDGSHSAKLAALQLHKAAKGTIKHHTEKHDDAMSFVAHRRKDGRVGVKYKGASAEYNYSHQDIIKQHGHKPYLANKMHHLLRHLHKVLPKREGTWQGGYMSSRSERHDNSQTPNTLTYHHDTDPKFGKSKLSVTLHTDLSSGHPRPADSSEFHHHPDVHVMQHEVRDRTLSDSVSKKIHRHVKAAHEILKGLDHSKHKGHEKTLRQYTNHAVRNKLKKSAEGYRNFLHERNEGEKASHVQSNPEHFNKLFKAHEHLQTAADTMAKHVRGNYRTSIDGKPSSGEGYVIGKNRLSKAVPREDFSAANFKNGEKRFGKKGST